MLECLDLYHQYKFSICAVVLIKKRTQINLYSWLLTRIPCLKKTLNHFIGKKNQTRTIMKQEL